MEAANWADMEEMTKLRELAKDGSPGYSVDARGLLCIADKVYVPEDALTLAVLLIRHVHEQPMTGHPGRNRMVLLLSTHFHLKNPAQRVAKYLKNCPVCCKLARHPGPPLLLRPLPVPDSPWRNMSVDFVRPLPTSDGFNMIMVVIDRLTKMRHYISCTVKDADSGTSAPAMDPLFLDPVFWLHGLHQQKIKLASWTSDSSDTQDAKNRNLHSGCHGVAPSCTWYAAVALCAPWYILGQTFCILCYLQFT